MTDDEEFRFDSFSKRREGSNDEKYGHHPANRQASKIAVHVFLKRFNISENIGKVSCKPNSEQDSRPF